MGKLENELPLHLCYHNSNHTRDVMQAAESIADGEGISGNKKRLLLTAALLHDTGFLVGRDGHEAISCNIAREYCPAYNYTQAEIDAICDMITATKIPQSPHNHLSEILCDADLDYFGRDDFFVLSNRLYTELLAEGIVKDEDEWNRQQTDFIGEHNYFTETSIKLRQSKKNQYVNVIKSKISTHVHNKN